MYRYYRYLKQTFIDWCKEEHLGISRRWWFTIGGLILLVVAVVMCHFCNHVSRRQGSYDVHHYGIKTSMHRAVHREWHR